MPRLAPALAFFALATGSLAARGAVQDFSVVTGVPGEPGAIGAVVVADFDGDGDNDLAWASRTNSRVSLARNERSTPGQYTRVTLKTVESVTRLAAADVDHDGRVDFVTASTGGTLVFHRNTGAVSNGVPQFDTRPAIASNVTGVTALALADMNEDGRADLVVGRDETPVLQVYTFSAASNSRFTGATNVAAPAGTAAIAGLALADFDGDGQRDIAGTGNFNPSNGVAGGHVFQILRSAGGGFAASVKIDSLVISSAIDPLLAYGPIVAFHDDATDGPDVAFALNDGDNGKLIALRNGGSGLLAPRRILDDAGAEFLALSASDIDHDGDEDIAFASGNALGWLEDLGDAIAPARQPVLLLGGATPVAVVADDADLDGDLDLFGILADGPVLKLRNVTMHGDPFAFGNVVSNRFGINSPLPGAFEIASRRTDRGPRREILFTEFTAGTLRVLQATRTGATVSTFLAAPLMQDIGAARALAVADFDYDGDDDAMIATGESSGAPPANQNRLLVSRNDSPPVNGPLGCQANDIRGLAIGDLLEPGFAGVYAAEDDDKLALFVNCPGETVISTAANGVPNGPNSAKLGDIDQDGDLDLLVAARLASTASLAGDLVGWYPNLGAGAFGPLVRLETVAGARDATFIDFDRDGRLDVATGSDGVGVLLLRNLGSGTFATPRVVAPGLAAPGRVEGADIDFDGDVDLVVPSSSASGRGPARTQCGLSLIRADGSGGFGAPECIDVSGFDPRAWTRAVIDDIDGNGVPDVAATSFDDNDVVLHSPGAPQNYVAVGGSDLPNGVLEPGIEQCVSFSDFEHFGLPGEADLSFPRVTSTAVASQGLDMVEALVLRLDDGDFLPEPGTDLELARTGSTTAAGNNARFTLQVQRPHAAVEGKRRYWLCVLTRARMPAASRLLELTLPDFPDVFVAATTRRAIGRVFFSGAFINLRSSTVFRDGVE
jgi:hypothetical protein